jgi:hypothetical protein
LGAALAASSVVWAARSLRVDELDLRARVAPPERIRIALDYWERGCIENRPFYADSKLRALRERLQISVEMEMRESPPIFAGAPVDVTMCIDGAGRVIEVVVNPSRAGLKWKDDIGRILRSWRYSAGEPHCSFERLWVRAANDGHGV